MREPTPKPSTEARELKERQDKARRKVEKLKREFDKRSADWGKQVASGEMDTATFRAHMLNEIRHMAISSAAAGAGGLGFLNPKDIQGIDGEVKKQAQYLDKWITQLERKAKEQLSEAGINNRIRKYGNIGGKIVHEMIDKVAHRDFPDLPFYPKDRTNCYDGCKCTWEWKKVDYGKGDADVYWTKHPAEHCQTCLNREDACFPLKIRNFKIINMPANMEDLLRQGA